MPGSNHTSEAYSLFIMGGDLDASKHADRDSLSRGRGINTREVAGYENVRKTKIF